MKEFYIEIIESLRKTDLLTDAVKLFLSGIIIGDNSLKDEDAQFLQRELGFDFEKYMGVEEAAIFGDIVDHRMQRVDFTKEELLKKDKPEASFRR